MVVDEPVAMINGRPVVIEVKAQRIEDAIERWQPNTNGFSRRHCSNCLHCKVTGWASEPKAYCAKGHGKVLPLETVIREHYPRGFRNAALCEDNEDQGEFQG